MKALKQFIYDLNTQRNTKRLIEALKTRLAGDEDIYIVHQMGRVASMTMVNTLRKAKPGTPIYHTHYLNTPLLQQRLEEMGRIGQRPNQRHYQVSKVLAPALPQYLDKHCWKVVTVVRDPVARNVSAFFLGIERYIPDFYQLYADQQIEMTEVVETFLRDYSHNIPLQWLDDEIKAPFGVDVYNESFPQERGYAILHHGTVDLLILKLESLHVCYREAFKAFMGIENASLQDTHITNKDSTRGAYNKLLSAMKLPEDFLDEMYASKYASHFFSRSEIANFKQKWLGAKT